MAVAIVVGEVVVVVVVAVWGCIELWDGCGRRDDGNVIDVVGIRDVITSLPSDGLHPPIEVRGGVVWYLQYSIHYGIS